MLDPRDMILHHLETEGPSMVAPIAQATGLSRRKVQEIVSRDPSIRPLGYARRQGWPWVYIIRRDQCRT